ncbi:hypothetical protein [Thalassoglobus polymorphus]|uniref:AP2 domain protein n=1 Tax=Thalassoglobus polymorphus TaxID=2527994 RepID=A0A517QMQ4_9PLAN|nr:hypothetical protein [Thalassoglobus polymorphus]QDT32926.1 hypothetical protein Mal48_21750 [Thalassoglobus polymorphus]
MTKKREARPWYRPSRSCWYITLDGKQHKLGDCSESEAWVRADTLKRQLKQEASAKAVSSDWGHL